MAQVSSKILSNLVEDVLDFAKIEAGNLDLNFDSFVISSLTEEIRFIFENQCHKKHINFTIIWEENILNSQFVSDLPRIRQILINIVSNSFKFTHQGGITIDINLFTERGNNVSRRYMKLIISDTGSGISDEDKIGNYKKLFI